MSASQRVSVVMPVYNGARYLAGAVDSVLAQTHGDLEIILVDDGSTDDGRTHAICAGYAAAHPGKVVYVRQENQGVAGALNTGLGYMTGDYFCWLSHDDGYVRGKLARQLAFHAALGDPDALVFTDFTLIGEQGQTLREVRLRRDKPQVDGLWPILGECVNGCSLLVPAHVIRAAGPFDTRYRFVQDYRLWWSMIRDHGFHHLAEPLVYHRIHPRQDTHKPEAIVEGEAFWRDVIFGLTPVERAQTAGSSLLFYEAMERQLGSGRYPEALADVAKAAAGCVAATTVTVAMADEGDNQATAGSAKGVLAQTHRNWELIVLAAPARAAEVRRMFGDDRRVTVVASEAPALIAAIDRAAELGEGEYLAPLKAGDVFEPRKLEMQLQLTQRAGRLVSHTALAGEAGDAAVQGEGPSPSTLLAHRAAIELGLFDAATDDAGLAARVAAFGLLHPVLALRHPLTRAAACDAALA